MVEHVESFGSELKIQVIVDRKRLKSGQIRVDCPRSYHGIVVRIPQPGLSAHRNLRVRRRVEPLSDFGMLAPARNTAFVVLALQGKGSAPGLNGLTRLGVFETVTERENGCCTRLESTRLFSLVLAGAIRKADALRPWMLCGGVLIRFPAT